MRAESPDRQNVQNSLLNYVKLPLFIGYSPIPCGAHGALESRVALVPRLEPSSPDYSHPEPSNFSNIRSSACFVLQLYCGQVQVLIQLLFLLHREQSVDIYKLKAGPLYPDDNTGG